MKYRLLSCVGVVALLALVTVPLLGAARVGEPGDSRPGTNKLAMLGSRGENRRSIAMQRALAENVCGLRGGDACGGVLWERGRVVRAAQTAVRNSPSCGSVLNSEAVVWEPVKYRGSIVLRSVVRDYDWQAFVANGRGDAAGAAGVCSDRQPAWPWRRGQTIAEIDAFGDVVGPPGVPENAAVRATFRQTHKIVIDLGPYPGDSDSVLFERNDKTRSVAEFGKSSARRAVLWIESRW